MTLSQRQLLVGRVQMSMICLARAGMKNPHYSSVREVAGGGKRAKQILQDEVLFSFCSVRDEFGSERAN